MSASPDISTGKNVPVRHTEPAPSRRQAAPASQLPETFWTDQWYPIAFTHDVPLGTLFSFRLFDRPFVLFKDQTTSAYVAADDTCPHCTAPLSRGLLVCDNGETTLGCGYRNCPSNRNSGAEPVAPSCTRDCGTYATSVTRADLVFFFAGDRSRADAVSIAQPDILCKSPYATVLRPFWRVLPLPFELVVENLVDPGHVPFAHHGTSEGDRNDFQSGHGHGGSGQKVVRRDEAGGEIETQGIRNGRHSLTATLRGGGTSVVTAIDIPVFELQLTFHVVPSARAETTVFAYPAMRPRPGVRLAFLLRWLLQLRRPRWLDHCLGHVVMDGDTPYLRATDGLFRQSGKTWRELYNLVNGTWDATVGVWRAWFERHGASMPFARPKSDADVRWMADDEINDRVRWHGRKCVSCTGALRNFRAGRMAAAVLAVVAATSAATCLVGVSAAVAHGQVALGRRLRVVAMQAAMCLVAAVLAAVGCNRGVQAMTSTDKARRLLAK